MSVELLEVTGTEDVSQREVLSAITFTDRRSMSESTNFVNFHAQPRFRGIHRGINRYLNVFKRIQHCSNIAFATTVNSAAPYDHQSLQVGGCMDLVRVLVVEDFPPFRRIICSLLRTNPELQVIIEASDGLEAVQKAEELQPNLILLDVGLPTLNGIEVARRIRKLSPNPKYSS
jgi:CheY-like chemotaxis protein